MLKDIKGCHVHVQLCCRANPRHQYFVCGSLTFAHCLGTLLQWTDRCQGGWWTGAAYCCRGICSWAVLAARVLLSGWAILEMVLPFSLCPIGFWYEGAGWHQRWVSWPHHILVGPHYWIWEAVSLSVHILLNSVSLGADLFFEAMRILIWCVWLLYSIQCTPTMSGWFLYSIGCIEDQFSSDMRDRIILFIGNTAEMAYLSSLCRSSIWVWCPFEALWASVRSSPQGIELSPSCPIAAAHDKQQLPHLRFLSWRSDHWHGGQGVRLRGYHAPSICWWGEVACDRQENPNEQVF